jgi:hypothetical protein
VLEARADLPRRTTVASWERRLPYPMRKSNGVPTITITSALLNA